MATQTHRVFVVDDEPIIAFTLATILQTHGFDAAPFTEPEAALEASLDRSPDLLITDVIMPVISGIELAHRVLGFCPDCKILLFSGEAGTVQFPDDAKGDGCFEILTKPVHPTELLEKIQEIFAASIALK